MSHPGDTDEECERCIQEDGFHGKVLSKWVTANIAVAGTIERRSLGFRKDVEPTEWRPSADQAGEGPMNYGKNADFQPARIDLSREASVSLGDVRLFPSPPGGNNRRASFVIDTVLRAGSRLRQEILSPRIFSKRRSAQNLHWGPSVHHIGNEQECLADGVAADIVPAFV
jgi:hypothetical protein